MQIVKSTDKVFSSNCPCIDAGSHIVINSVPYNKETNSPVPFCTVSAPCDSRWAFGKSGMNLYPFINATSYTQYNITDYKIKNVIIDNKDPNTVYAFTNKDDNGIVFDNKADSEYNSKNQKFYAGGILKIDKTKENNIITTSNYPSRSMVYSDASSTHKNLYLTQSENHLFALTAHPYTSGNSSCHYHNHFICMEIYTKDLNYIGNRYLNLYSLTNKSYDDGTSWDSDTGYYNAHYVCKVLFENKDGLLIYVDGIFQTSTNDNKLYTNSRYIWFSFKTMLFENIETIREENGFLPNTLPVLKSSTAHSITSNYSVMLELIKAIPSAYKETDTYLYGYYYAKGSTSTSSDVYYETNFDNWKLFLIKHNKDNLLVANFKTIGLVKYNEETSAYDEYKLPNSSISSVSNASLNCLVQRRYYETFFSTVNGKDYVHIIYKGVYEYVPERGIYTFEVNEDKTQAVFVSYYPALGGTLYEFLPVKEDNNRIVLATNSSYHVLNFDGIAKKWVSSFDSLNKMQSCIHTDENKLYVILADNSIVCHDLEGAVILDFDFEKTSYNYNNADIDSYISIWAKNADSDYVATNIKLTIVGDAVWKQNGEKTLNTTTAASGPSNIPFTIKGQTAINVSVDAVI